MSDQERLPEASANLHAPATDDQDSGEVVSKIERLELDRFIPNRSTTNWDYGRAVLAERRPSERRFGDIKPGMYEEEVLYTLKLKKHLGLETSRIFRYRNNLKPSAEVVYAPGNSYNFTMKWLTDYQRRVPGRVRTRRNLNLMDWGMHDVIAIGVGRRLWFAHSDPESLPYVGPSYGGDEVINGVSWSPELTDALAVGLKNSPVHLLDPYTNQKIREFDSCGVGSLAWNGRILTTGNLKGHIVNYDVRVGNQVSRLSESHQGAICGLKWSASGQLLASGGLDNVVNVWDARSMPTRSLHKLQDHNAAVRAVAWSPLKRHLLASGGGEGDHYIRLWDANSGTPHENASVDTGSEVCGLFWSKHHRDKLFSTHGFGGSQSVRDSRLILWRSPMMFKINEMYIESDDDDDLTVPRPRRSFFSTQSPEGYHVATAGDNKKLNYFYLFTPPPPEPATKPPFSTYNRPNHYTLR